jgi:hypothetical protein
MTAISYATAVDPRTLPFKDRRTSLKVAGVLLILLGSLFGCFGALTPVAMFVATRFTPAAPTTQGVVQPPGPSGADYHAMVLAGGTYVLMAAVFIWLGVGSVRVRRWARPVLLVVGWSWLLAGAVSFGHWALFGASMRDMMMASWQPGAPPPPRSAVYVATAAMGAITFVFLVLLPALIVWVFTRRGVRETVQYFDDRFAWTDRCPTPVLAVSAWLLVAALGSVLYSVYAVLPVYGHFVTGPAAVAALVALAAVFLWVAYGVYRLRNWAWWATAVLWTAWSGSMVWTFTWTGYSEFYRRAGYSPRDIDMQMRYGGQFEDSTVWMIALWSVALFGYLLYLRKYFVAGPPPEPTGETALPGSPPEPAPAP